MNQVLLDEAKMNAIDFAHYFAAPLQPMFNAQPHAIIKHLRTLQLLRSHVNCATCGGNMSEISRKDRLDNHAWLVCTSMYIQGVIDLLLLLLGINNSSTQTQWGTRPKPTIRFSHYMKLVPHFTALSISFYIPFQLQKSHQITTEND